MERRFLTYLTLLLVLHFLNHSTLVIATAGKAVTCGEELIAVEPGFVKSPGFPRDYTPQSHCEWVVHAPEPGQRIIVNFNPHFDMEKHDCRFDYVELRDGENASSSLLGKFCGNIAPAPISSSGQNMFIKFVSDMDNQGAGFSLQYKPFKLGADECSKNFSALQGVIQSPNFPQKYPNFLDCTYIIHTSPQNEITLYFEHFSLESDATGREDRVDAGTAGSGATGRSLPRPCRFDRLEIWDGLPNVGLEVGRYCGSTSPPKLKSSTGVLSLVFHTDTAVAKEGFSANYTIHRKEVSETIMCDGALGLKSRWISDNQITASSQYYTGLWSPQLGRLQNPVNAWTPLQDSSKEWIQVDLGFPKIVTGVATQGAVSHESGTSYYVTNYRLEHSTSGEDWVSYREGRSIREFDGNSDGMTVVVNRLAEPLLARYVRLRPTRWREGIALRLEYYGCQLTDFPCSDLLGMISGRIPDTRISASSVQGVNWGPGSARLLNPRFAWSPRAHSASDQWLQVDLGSPWLLSGMLTQGAKGGNGHQQKLYVRRYRLLHSEDGLGWTPVRDHGHDEPKSFIGNFHPDKLELRRFEVVRARYVRLLPEKWSASGIALRLEMLGCSIAEPTTQPPTHGIQVVEQSSTAGNSGSSRTPTMTEPLLQSFGGNSIENELLLPEIPTDRDTWPSFDGGHYAMITAAPSPTAGSGLLSLDPILIAIIGLSALGILLGAACTGLLLYCSCVYARQPGSQRLAALERYNFELYDGKAKGKLNQQHTSSEA
uniref:Neuropilin n=1 Tax=Eptatretus burgeri TaxID=7764 RepID=A0A8C4WZ29_EPTBU